MKHAAVALLFVLAAPGFAGSEADDALEALRKDWKKLPEERRTNGLRVPLTDAERELVENAADADGEKPVTWSRNAILRAAKRCQKRT